MKLCLRHYSGWQQNWKKGREDTFPEVKCRLCSSHWKCTWRPSLQGSSKSIGKPSAKKTICRPSTHSQPSLPLAKPCEEPVASNTLKPAGWFPKGTSAKVSWGQWGRWQNTEKQKKSDMGTGRDRCVKKLKWRQTQIRRSMKSWTVWAWPDNKNWNYWNCHH